MESSRVVGNNSVEVEGSLVVDCASVEELKDSMVVNVDVVEELNSPSFVVVGSVVVTSKERNQNDKVPF